MRKLRLRKSIWPWSPISSQPYQGELRSVQLLILCPFPCVESLCTSQPCGKRLSGFKLSRNIVCVWGEVSGYP